MCRYVNDPSAHPTLIANAIKPKAKLIKNNRKSSFRSTDIHTHESIQSIGYIHEQQCQLISCYKTYDPYSNNL